MGLDIYLYEYTAPVEEVLAAEKLVEEEESRRIWADGVFENLTKNERDDIRQEIKDKYPLAAAQKSISETPKSHPDDICQIGYIRSSYNESGMNRRLSTAVGKDLYWLFGINREDEEYIVKPDWEASLARLDQLLIEVKQKIDQYGGVDIFAVSPNMFADPSTLPQSAEDAMKIYEAQADKHVSRDDGMFDCYSNRDGHFDMSKEPMRVRALIPGMKNILGELPCVYVVIDTTTEDGEQGGLNWAKKSLEVVRETIEFAINHPNRENLRFHWSG